MMGASRNSSLNIARTPPEILGHTFHLKLSPELDSYPVLYEGGLEQFPLRLPPPVRGRLPYPGTLDLIWKIGNDDTSVPGPHHLTSSWPEQSVMSSLSMKPSRTHSGPRCAQCYPEGSPEEHELGPIGGYRFHIDPRRRMCSTQQYRVDLFERRGRFRFLRPTPLSKTTTVLHLSGTFMVSSWDHLTPHPMALVTLSLRPDGAASPEPIATTSQILPLPTFDPNLRSLTLELLEFTNNGRDG